MDFGNNNKSVKHKYKQMRSVGITKKNKNQKIKKKDIGKGTTEGY